MDHRELYYTLAKYIASAPEEDREDLCRQFRINPSDVEAAKTPENKCIHCDAGRSLHDDGMHRQLGWEIPCPNGTLDRS